MSGTITKLASGIAVLAGAIGVGVVLYAWRLPPFNDGTQVTDNAYVAGKVTIIAPQLAGYIVRISVADYDEVSEGQLILQLDDRIYRERLEQAQAQLLAQQSSLSSSAQSERSAEARIKSAEASAQAAQVSRDNAEVNAKRQQELSERGTSSRASLDDANVALSQAQATYAQTRANLEVARQDLQTVIVDRETLEADVKAAEAVVELAKIDLSNTRIIAPVAGKLGEVGARVGAYVTPGTQLTSIVTADRWVVANFKETQVRNMYVGMPVTMVLDIAKDLHYSGTIEAFSPASGSQFSVLKPDNATGNFTKVVQRLPVKIAFDKDMPDFDLIAPGLSVTVTAKTGTPRPQAAASTTTPPSAPAN